ncbi:MAG: hypothetical protein PHS34_09290 [Candidatus Omnitrophica bacterium]|nr:hypothetical protein [Candidatus Nanoarchaeia archaeon]MDD5551441.1 hypothetical protein [Candidatus Omnitrophota bacterium]
MEDSDKTEKDYCRLPETIFLERKDQHSDSKDSVLEDILSLKEKLLQQSIDELTKLIEERLQIKQKVFTDLDKEVSRTRNVTLETLTRKAYNSTLENSEIIPFEIWINKLEKGKIDENVQSWQDIVDLRKQIITLMTKLIESKEKKRMFDEK